ncbi:MAG: transporter substrate-binding domain-containing protein [Selenomonadaceae bacterium]|nr:transporter substrate-binding domain-containing protein [Selenomonadaceae bacterium]
MNITENAFKELVNKIESALKVDIISHRAVFFNNLNVMQAGLQSQQIDEISTYRSVARYIIAQNPKYTVLENHSLDFVDAFCFALRKDHEDLRNVLDSAITELKDNGTLDKLVNTYITKINSAEEIPETELPHIEGADTIKVAVTGDLPPMDYVAADGHSTGFNVALLGEIGKIIGKNFELIRVDSAGSNRWRNTRRFRCLRRTFGH